jgi:DNA-binding GntR family transcriptional regulator
MTNMGQLDPDDSRPPYVQVADAIRQDIADEVLKPGAKLPSHMAIAEQYGVSVGTIKRALGELQGSGFVISRQGQGAFVRTHLPDSARDPHEFGELRELLARHEARLDAIERRLSDL